MLIIIVLVVSVSDLVNHVLDTELNSLYINLHPPFSCRAFLIISGKLGDK
jgi:hypothetical protein